MSVTLDVSKLSSGWLNAVAYCRAERRAYDAGRGVRAGRREGGGRHTQRAGEGSTAEGAGHGEERTENMWFMSVTLDVSKLSGWLNFHASCRESKGGVRCGTRWGPGGGRAASNGGTRSVQGRAWLQIWGRARGGVGGRGGDHGANRSGRSVLKRRAREGSRWRSAGLTLTLNISPMSVTPEVFQLEMFASKCVKPENSPFMSETDETSQLAMGPYVAMVEAASAS